MSAGNGAATERIPGTKEKDPGAKRSSRPGLLVGVVVWLLG
ncbi:MAG: hypothetical protein ACREA1_02015 [Nitrosotalea sp.]